MKRGGDTKKKRTEENEERDRECGRVEREEGERKTIVKVRTRNTRGMRYDLKEWGKEGRACM